MSALKEEVRRQDRWGGARESFAERPATGAGPPGRGKGDSRLKVGL